ncbi:MAG: phosphatase PAP2 family protein [Prevotellaceae bacterium]|jgi:hypothetical protein|nr:phosphatase PAP2 family protein [Prevotellaceae bacterium]
MNSNFTSQILLFICISVINANLLSAQSDTFFVAHDTVNIQQTTIQHSKTNILINAAIPSLLIAYGVHSLYNNKLRKIDTDIGNTIHRRYLMKNNLDDYLQFSPAAAAFAMKIAGVKSKHNLFEMGIIYGLSNALQSAIISTAKGAALRTRPDNSNSFSFPSGHTAVAFVAAEFLHQEYKDQSVWISIGGYTMASLIGVSRMLNEEHWFSDVVAGAGIGILSTKIIYWTFPTMQKLFGRKKSNHSQALIFPTYNNKTLGLNFSYRF